MNRERAKELLPIIQAYAEGKEIEYKWISDDDGPDGAWITPDGTFESGGEYRIKPEPFECWVNVYDTDGKSRYSYDSEEAAEKNISGTCRTIHMIEKTDE